MITQIESIHIVPRTRSCRTVVVVSGHPHRDFLNAVLSAVDHDVVFVESTLHAYSQIKRVTPDLVIVCLSSDDLDGCQVLSMLRLDSETSRIPVLTYMTSPSDGLSSVAADEDVFCQAVPVSLN